MAFKKACVLLALLAATATTVSAQARTVPLDAFTAIEACLPFNFVISPSKGTTYQMIVQADTGVAAAVNASVSNGVLSLGLANNQPNNLLFKATNPIKLAVQLPADQLASVAVSSIPSTTVAVASGFSVPSFAASITGTSTLTVQGLTADKGEFINAGTGTMYVSGKLQSVLVSSSGTGTAYVLGVSQRAAVQASGISKVFIGGTSQTHITGQVSGISSVVYDQGVCSVSSQFGGIFGSPCTQQQKISPPSSLRMPQWSCALTIYGTFGCSDGQTPSNGNGGTSSSSSSSSNGGSGTTYTSQTVNGVTTTSSGSSSPDGSSSLSTGTGTLQMGSCSQSGSALDMFKST